VSKRATISLLVVLDADTPGGDDVELRVETRGVDYFRAEDLTGIDPWEALSELGNERRLSNRFLRAVHALGYCAAHRIAPSMVGDSFDDFLDRAIEVSVTGSDSEGDEGAPDARPTVAAAGSA
jgi:hypothetical protein